MTNKDPKNMTSKELKELKIEFAPGAFDNFEGTQEELDEMMAHIKNMILSGELFEKANPIDIDELLDSDDPDDHELAEKLLRASDQISSSRKLQ
jgi:hypothetical protein